MKYSLFFLLFFCFFTHILTDEKLLYVDVIKHLLGNNYLDLDDQEHSIAFYDSVISLLDTLTPEELLPLKNYIEQLDNGLLYFDNDDEPIIKKKLKSKILCSLIVKNKLLAHDLIVCNDSTLNHVTVNGTINFPTTCLNVNCINTNNLTAHFITTDTLVASTIIGTFTVTSALTSVTAQFFTGPLYGDVTGTEFNTIVSTVCGIPACTLAQTFSTVLSGTSADIPNTLVLRDGTGSFAATTITLTGGIMFSDSLSVIGQIFVDQNALNIVPTTPRALQTTSDGATRGASTIDLQMARSTNSQVASGSYAGLLSGSGNTASANFTVVGGGYNNQATAVGSVVIGGGTDGTIFAGNTISGFASVIGAGINNSAALYAGILTGSGNLAGAGIISPIMQVVAGGIRNIATNAGDVIIGGGFDGINYGGNTLSERPGFIGCGISNTLASNAYVVTGSAIVAVGNFATSSSCAGTGQANNLSSSTNSFMGSGLNHIFNNQSDSCIVTGSHNSVTRSGSAIFCGGFDGLLMGGNTISGPASFIGTGIGNTTNSALYAAILTGSGNTFSGANNFSYIGTGQNNTITTLYTTLINGCNNTLSGEGTVICAGGFDGQVTGGNTAAGATSFIGNGLNNTINSTYSAISSGSGNSLTGSFNSIGTGQNNNLGSGTKNVAFTGNNNKLLVGQCSLLTGSGNIITLTNSTIVGGGYDGIHTGTKNTLNANSSFIGNGIGNFNNGLLNTALVNGLNNRINNSGEFSFLGNGQNNNINQLSIRFYITLFNGINNSASNSFATLLTASGCVMSGLGGVLLGGGFDGINSSGNTNSGLATFIGNGLNNSVPNSYCGILSGTTNTITGNYAAIVGGVTNIAGLSSFAAGTGAYAINNGSFVWADTSFPGSFSSNGNNTFNVRAAGGTFIVTTTLPAFPAGVKLTAGSTSWSQLSDANTKIIIMPANISEISSLVMTLTTYTYNLISQDDSFTNVGPIAQDFYSTFGYGEDPTYININDSLGVLMSSIQELYQTYIISAQLKKKYLKQHEYLQELEQRLKKLETTKVVNHAY